MKAVKELHNVHDRWLENRTVEWFYSETKGKWWICWPRHDGKPMYATYRQDWEPSEERKEFAFKICSYINREAGEGGVWMAGYIDKDLDQEFYLLWRDHDGDIQIPIEFPQQFKELSEKWSEDDFLTHCGDRKSARLNSSHQKTSYAVF